MQEPCTLNLRRILAGAGQGMLTSATSPIRTSGTKPCVRRNESASPVPYELRISSPEAMSARALKKGAGECGAIERKGSGRLVRLGRACRRTPLNGANQRYHYHTKSREEGEAGTSSGPYYRRL